jgi:hypothetical protein
MTAKLNIVEKIAEEERIKKEVETRLANLPRGMDFNEMRSAMMDARNASLIERSIDDFMKIIIAKIALNRFTNLNEDRLDMFYKAQLSNDFFYKRFAKRNKDKYTKFIDEIKELLVSLDGQGLKIYENAIAGREPQSAGIFRSILGSVMGRVSGDGAKKPQ